METIQITFNGKLSSQVAIDCLIAATDHTLRRLRDGLAPSELLVEIRTALTQLAATAGTPDTNFALHACAVLGAALAEGIGPEPDPTDADCYIEDRIDDLLATVASLDRLMEKIGRRNLAESTQRLLGDASVVSEDDFEDGDYLGDLFLATANAMALALSIQV